METDAVAVAREEGRRTKIQLRLNGLERLRKEEKRRSNVLKITTYLTSLTITRIQHHEIRYSTTLDSITYCSFQKAI
jgi:hypothetical protein